MSSNSHDWSALASHNERVVTPSALQTGLNPRQAGAGAASPVRRSSQGADPAAEAGCSVRCRCTRVTA